MSQWVSDLCMLLRALLLTSPLSLWSGSGSKAASGDAVVIMGLSEAISSATGAEGLPGVCRRQNPANRNKMLQSTWSGELPATSINDLSQGDTVLAVVTLVNRRQGNTHWTCIQQQYAMQTSESKASQEADVLTLVLHASCQCLYRHSGTLHWTAPLCSPCCADHCHWSLMCQTHQAGWESTHRSQENNLQDSTSCLN